MTLVLDNCDCASFADPSLSPVDVISDATETLTTPAVTRHVLVPAHGINAEETLLSMANEILMYICQYLGDLDCCAVRASCRRLRTIINSLEMLPPHTLVMKPLRTGDILADKMDAVNDFLRSKVQCDKINAVILGSTYHCHQMHAYMELLNPYNACMMFMSLLKRVSDEPRVCNLLTRFPRILKIRANGCVFWRNNCAANAPGF